MSTTESLGSQANSYKHGLFAKDELFLAKMLPEDKPVHEEIRNSLLELYKPEIKLEEMLVEKLAVQYFRVFHLYRLEYASAVASRKSPLADNSILHHLDRFSRYDYRMDRQLRVLHNRIRSLMSSREISGMKPPHFSE